MATTIVEQFNGTGDCKEARVSVDDAGGIYIEGIDGESYTKKGLLDLVRLLVDVCDSLDVSVDDEDPNQLKFDFAYFNEEEEEDGKEDDGVEDYALHTSEDIGISMDVERDIETNAYSFLNALSDFKEGKISKNDFIVALTHVRSGIDRFLEGERHNERQESKEAGTDTA